MERDGAGGVGLLKRSEKRWIFLLLVSNQLSKYLPKHTAIVRASISSIPDAKAGAEVHFCAQLHLFDTSMFVPQLIVLGFVKLLVMNVEPECY